eukprot:TRINITY_DN832_c0_g1_i1.p1 TRINITY_DN832_c0_g1~~TRINITY_DN832_c0_g1_i1.p1  ORF type:complete len:364 (-),score=86.06 TRINITY_DN832_c0_g1_i1:112-1203(-)
MFNNVFFYLIFFSCLYFSIISQHNTVDPSNFVDVFSKGEAGYYCIKIPDILTTFDGVLLAFGEGRRESCSDFTWTDLVLKRSFDNGTTWSELQIVHTNSTHSDMNVIGNAAPVQLKQNSRILVPFTRNNLEVWLTYSDDDGKTWSTPTNISKNVVEEDWEWIGTGPPASLQLPSGRVITCTYASSFPFHQGDGAFSHSFVMYSDDYTNWYKGDMIDGPYYTSECQIVSLQNGTLLMNTRGHLAFRVQALSTDDGLTWKKPYEASDIVEPIGGCEGSLIKHPENNWLFFSGPNNPRPERFNVSVFISKDEGNSYDLYSVINPGRSAYSALTILPDNSVGLLFERSNLTQFVFEPTEISYLKVWP